MDAKPKRRTRERILEAALDLFNEYGVPGVATATIAETMNISPGNLYYHFHSKDKIIEALFSQFKQEIESNSDRAGKPDDPRRGHLAVPASFVRGDRQIPVRLSRPQ